MANDCYNYLEAPDGDLSLIADYFSTAKREYSRFQKYFLISKRFFLFLPRPGRPISYRLPNGMHWCVWGTKWNSYDGNVTDEGISFNTAWSPPVLL
jgi:hypothetical protein